MVQIQMNLMNIHKHLCLESFIISCTNQIPMINLLLVHGVNVNHRKDDGTSAIHYAKGEIATILINHKADLNIKSYGGNTVLHGCFDKITADIFFSHGLDPNIQNNIGETPLHEAVYFGPDIVKCLIQHGADTNIQNNDGNTPLMKLAMSYGFDDEDVNEMIEVCDLLKFHGSSAIHKNKENQNAYDLCIKEKNFKFADYIKSIM